MKGSIIFPCSALRSFLFGGDLFRAFLLLLEGVDVELWLF